MPANNPFGTYTPYVDSPAANAALVTPNDNDDLVDATRSIYVGSAGTLRVTTVGGQTLTLPSLSGWLPLRVTRIHATGTTATSIVAFW